MADDTLGLSDRDQELRKWNQPYVYREFPKMLYRGSTTTAGKIEIAQRVVGSEGEEALATGAGWRPHPQLATDLAIAAQEALGTAAAERAWDDRRMTPAAQAEAAAVDAQTARHLGEIPEQPKRPRSHRKKE